MTEQNSSVVSGATIPMESPIPMEATLPTESTIPTMSTIPPVSTVSKGLLKGLVINYDKLPQHADFTFVKTYKENRYRMHFHTFNMKEVKKDANGLLVKTTTRNFAVDICALHNMEHLHNHGELTDIIAKLEKIEACDQCKKPMENEENIVPLFCEDCTTQNCFTFNEMKVDECSICLRELKGSSSMIFTTDCEHVFHNRCFSKIKPKRHIHVHNHDGDDEPEMRAVRECPTCRADVIENLHCHG
jgi:hypothetical protein